MRRPDGGTEAAALMSDHIGKTPTAPVAGTAVLEPLPAQDAFDMTEGDKAAFGIKDHETWLWERDSSGVWADKDPRRIETTARARNGRVLKDEAGNLIRPIGLPGSDLVAIAYPKAIAEKREAQQQQVLQDYMYQFAEEQGSHHEEKWENTRDQIQAAIEATKRFKTQMQAGAFASGSSTQGRTLEDVLRDKSSEDMEAEMARYRHGPEHREVSDAEFHAMLTGEKAGKGKTYGVGAGLGNKNPNSAVAQAARAAQRR